MSICDTKVSSIFQAFFSVQFLCDNKSYGLLIAPSWMSQEDLGVSRAADFMADTSDEVPKKTPSLTGYDWSTTRAIER